MKTTAWECTSFFWIRGDKAELYDIIYVDLVGGISKGLFISWSSNLTTSFDSENKNELHQTELID